MVKPWHSCCALYRSYSTARALNVGKEAVKLGLHHASSTFAYFYSCQFFIFYQSPKRGH
ncbi:MAG: hypothetical protein PHU14_16705 [Methylovulum sp.]|nr:hypothetical protein [Methylovulum sp.]